MKSVLMYHSTMRLTVVFTFAVLIIGIALTLPLFTDRGSKDAAPQTQLTDENVPHVTPPEARRIHEPGQADQPGQPVEPSVSDSEHGVVLERTQNQIRLEGGVTPRSWPLAEEVSVWQHGQEVLTPAGPAEISYTGQVAELRNRVIVIVDSLGDRLEFPVLASATVRNHNDVGSLHRVQLGDTVTVIGSRIGTAAHGDTIQVSRIAILPEAEQSRSGTAKSE